ncbi:MAG: NAD dependent epimerase/dehydratase family enzyme [Rubritalea sp.]|jgi:NAD dependent epimerase/dehydratase family enzyme
MKMSEIKTMMVAGANGFMGRYISRYFLEKGWRVFGLARRPNGLANGVEFIKWDGETLETSWTEVLEGVDVLINLAGRTVDCRYNDENKRQILDSRVNSTKVLGDAVAVCVSPPSV